MTNLTASRHEVLNGKKLSIFDIVRDGQRLASVMTWDSPFAKWSVHTDSGRVQFDTKADAMNYCTML